MTYQKGKLGKKSKAIKVPLEKFQDTRHNVAETQQKKQVARRKFAYGKG